MSVEIYACCWNPQCDGSEGNPFHCQPPLPETPIQRLRTKYGITRGELAVLTGIPEVAVERFEDGSMLPSPKWANIFADALGIADAERRELGLWLSERILDKRAAAPLPGTPKLTADQVREIIELRAACPFHRFPAGHPANLQTMADRFGVTKACISRIAHGYSWRELRKAETAEEAAGLPDRIEEDDAC